MNSPLVSIRSPEIMEKINIFFVDFSSNINKRNLKNKRERKICKLIDEICPQIQILIGIKEKIEELIYDNQFGKKFLFIL